MELLKNESGTTVLFSSAPNREDMCCVVGYVNCSEKHDSSAKSSYHWQIFRCRYYLQQRESEAGGWEKWSTL